MSVILIVALMLANERGRAALWPGPNCLYMASGAQYAEDAREEGGNIVDTARGDLRGSLAPGDAVRRSWFDFKADDWTVRVVCGGRAVAIVRYLEVENGGWLASETTTCVDF